MKEILGENLEQFFNKEIKGKCTYKGKEYEVWEVSDEVFDIMCDMSDDKFEELAGENAWWRYAEGSILGYPDSKVYINGCELWGWAEEDYWEDEEDEEDDGEYDVEESKIYSSVTTYILDVFSLSQPRNVCAIAVDLAKYNNMTLGELFAKCEC